MSKDIDSTLEAFNSKCRELNTEFSKVVIGLEDCKKQLLITIFAGAHALLEGVPGVGKTLLVKTLSNLLELKYKRIQFTPDLMPADILGSTVLTSDERGARSFRFEKGPIFANIVLADEINRATPKTQSALLECMQERTVTIHNQVFELERPFVVIATENPIEMEGTYPLPEAQLDRFIFKIKVETPTPAQLVEILEKTTGAGQTTVNTVLSKAMLIDFQALIREVPIAAPLTGYVSRLIHNTHPISRDSPEPVKKYVKYGASPRGAQSIILAAKANALISGRYNVSYDDIREVAVAALRHRLILNFEAEADMISVDKIINTVISQTPEIQ